MSLQKNSRDIVSDFQTEDHQVVFYRKCYVLFLQHIMLINGNKWANIENNMNYMKIYK